MTICQRVLRRLCSDSGTCKATCVTAGQPYAHQKCFATTPVREDKAPKELLGLKTLDDEEHHRLAREWTQGFTVHDIPKASYETSYARSSGPGGQVSCVLAWIVRCAHGAAREHDKLQSSDQAPFTAGVRKLAAQVCASGAVGHGVFLRLGAPSTY